MDVTNQRIELGDFWRQQQRHHRRHRINSSDILVANRRSLTDYYTTLRHAHIQQYTASDHVTAQGVTSRLSRDMKHSDEMSSSTGSGNEDRTGSETSESDTNIQHVTTKDADGVAPSGRSSSSGDMLHTGDIQDTNSHGDNTTTGTPPHRPQHKQVRH